MPPPSPDPGPPATPDETRFDRLFEIHYNPLRRYACRYLRSWEEAEDVVHDVFASLWARHGELESITDPSAYLYTATRNRCLSRLKHLAHETRWQATESARQEESPAELVSPERDLARREIAAAVQRALDELTPRQREAILLQWRGRTYDEIGSALGISPKTVSVHLSRAFEALRELLGDLRP